MQNGTVSASDVLARIKDWLELDSDAELAAELEVSPSTLSSWRQRNSVPYAVCVVFSLNNEIALDWLLLGRGGDVPWKLGEGGDRLNADVLRLSVEELSGSGGFNILPPEQIAKAIGDLYKKYSEVLQDGEDAGLKREDLINIIRRVGETRGIGAVLEYMTTEIDKKKS